jgi:hypothetical protein
MRENKRLHKAEAQRNIPLSRINSQASLLPMDTPSPDRCHFFPSPGATNTGAGMNGHLDQLIPDLSPRSIPSGIALSRESTYSSSTLSFFPENSPYEQESSLAENPPRREPLLSWFLTIFLLIIVTGVSYRAFFYSI